MKKKVFYLFMIMLTTLTIMACHSCHNPSSNIIVEKSL